MPVKHVHWGHCVGVGSLMGNLVVCLAGNRRRKQMEGSGGFTASWCIHLCGGTIPPAQPWLILTGSKEAVRETSLLSLWVLGCTAALLLYNTEVNCTETAEHSHRAVNRTCGWLETTDCGFAHAINDKVNTHNCPLVYLFFVTILWIKGEPLPQHS